MGIRMTKLATFDAKYTRPPRDAVAFGVTPDGKQLFKRTLRRAKGVPKIDPKTGEQEWAKNPQNGEPLYKKNRPEIYTDDRIFYMEDQGNGNVAMVQWVPPSQKEVEEAEFRGKVTAMKDQLAETLVRRGVSVDDLLNSLVNGTPLQAAALPIQSSEPQGEAEIVPEQAEIKLGVAEHLGAGWWMLSNGTKFRGSKEDAEEQEQRIYEAKLEAATAPTH